MRGPGLRKFRKKPRRSLRRARRTKRTIRVSLFGLGYVGCVTSVALAKSGHEVVGVDVNPRKVEMINAAQAPVVEPGLGPLLAGMVGTGRLRATVSTDDALSVSDMALVSVGTPSRANGQLDTSAIRHVGQEIGR